MEAWGLRMQGELGQAAHHPPRERFPYLMAVACQDLTVSLGSTSTGPSCLTRTRASLVPQTVKNLPAMQETWVQSPGWEDPLKEGMATHSSILAWRIPMDRGGFRAPMESVGYSPWGRKESDETERLSTFTYTGCLWCLSLCPCWLSTRLSPQPLAPMSPRPGLLSPSIS